MAVISAYFKRELLLAFKEQVYLIQLRLRLNWL